MDILGVKLNVTSMKHTLSTIERWIEKKEPHYVCVTSAHGIIESQRNKEFRDIINSAGLVTPDGMPLVWLSRFKGYKSVDRVYGPDLMLKLSELAERRGYSNFFYGARNGIPEKLSIALRKKFPHLKIAGTYSPPFRPLTSKEDREVIDMINDASPDIVWVGISTPKQEKWMAEHLGRTKTTVMIGVGAAFDFLSGAKRQAPKWMQRSGLEWLFRLITEPRRLWRRYLIGNTMFIWSILKEFFQKRNPHQKDKENKNER